MGRNQSLSSNFLTSESNGSKFTDAGEFARIANDRYTRDVRREERERCLRSWLSMEELLQRHGQSAPASSVASTG